MRKIPPGLILGLTVGAIIAAALILGLGLSDDRDPGSTTDTTTVQERWGCAEDEIVYFGGDPGVECVSQEEDARRQRNS